VAQELTAPRGGSLDILAADGDTYYSIEVQLGDVDASHSFRVSTTGRATGGMLAGDEVLHRRYSGRVTCATL
jgi:hypothetical protein